MTKVLFIFRCSKNWQKKSVHHHLLANNGAHFFLPIFTAATDEKYFSYLTILQIDWPKAQKCFDDLAELVLWYILSFKD